MYAVRRALVAGVWLAACLFPATALAAGDFVTFETGQVRPLALSPSGARSAKAPMAEPSTRRRVRSRPAA
jgi:hypothetical protein